MESEGDFGVIVRGPIHRDALNQLTCDVEYRPHGVDTDLAAGRVTVVAETEFTDNAGQSVKSPPSLLMFPWRRNRYVAQKWPLGLSAADLGDPRLVLKFRELQTGDLPRLLQFGDASQRLESLLAAHLSLPVRMDNRDVGTWALAPITSAQRAGLRDVEFGWLLSGREKE